MRAATIQRKLRALDVPIEKAKLAAERFGDDGGIPTPTDALLKALRRAARQKAQDQFRREYRIWCKVNGLPLPQFEFSFHPSRHWRLDICWSDIEGTGGVYLENDGGGWVQGRHHRPKGFAEDQAKRNAAVARGWRPLHCTPQTLYSEAVLEQLQKLLLTQRALTLTQEAP